MIGAGPVGYTIAMLMAKRGFKIDMFEKRPDPLETSQSGEWRSTNLLIFGRSFEALKRIGVLDEFLNRSVYMDRITYVLKNMDELTMVFTGKTP